MITDRFGPFVQLDIPDEYKRSVHCVSRAKAVAVDIARPNVHLFHVTIRTSRYNQDPDSHGSAVGAPKRKALKHGRKQEEGTVVGRLFLSQQASRKLPASFDVPPPGGTTFLDIQLLNCLG